MAGKNQPYALLDAFLRRFAALKIFSISKTSEFHPRKGGVHNFSKRFEIQKGETGKA